MKWHHRFYITAAQLCFLPSHAQSLNTPTQSLFIRRGQCQSLPMLGNEENDGDGDHTEYNGIVHQATVVPWLRNSLRIYWRKFWADIPDIPAKGKTITNSCYHYGEHMVLYMQTYDVVVYASGWRWTKLKHRTYFQPKTILKPRRNGPHFAENIFKSTFFDKDISILIQIWSISVPKYSIEKQSVQVRVKVTCRTDDNPLHEPVLPNKHEVIWHHCISISYTPGWFLMT